MTQTTITVQLPEPLMENARQMARSEGISLDEWVSSSLAERLRSQQATEEFFRQRAAGASGEALRRALENSPDLPPEPGDELPEGYISSRHR